MSVSLDDNKTSLLEFAEKGPSVLLRHPSTAPLALKIGALNLASALTSRFIIAFVGEIGSGKSTLVNALIGQRLAPVGVDETTATVNRFRYGADGDRTRFRVHGEDGMTEDRPLAELPDWVGHADNVRRTRLLDVFASSDLLASADIVDTPGTPAAQQDAIGADLGAKLEAETLRHGSRADAVVYVLNPTLDPEDKRHLRWFRDRGSLPGAAPINSIAVVQGWEHLRPDPLAAVERLCDRIRGQLAGDVSEVLPVSGLLALCALDLPDRLWQRVVQLGVESKPEVFERLVRSEQDFIARRRGAPVGLTRRRALLAKLPWPVLSFALWLARRDRPTSGSELKATLLCGSNIDRLRRLIKTQFLDLAGPIQVGTALRRAWEPCAAASITFANEVEKRRERLRLSEIAAQTLAQKTDPDLDVVRACLEASKCDIEQDLTLLSAAWHDFDEMYHRAQRNLRMLDADLECLRHLETTDDLSDDERRDLQRLFGRSGQEVHARLGIDAGASLDAALDRAGRQFDHWKVCGVKAEGSRRSLFAHAVERLETILDHLEADA